MTKNILIIAFSFVFIINCSRSKDKPAPLVLDLGKPGTIEVKGDLHPNDNVIVLDKNETVEFKTEDGEAIIKHKKPNAIKPGDIIVTNEDQRYILKVKEVRETLDNGTHVVVRQSNIEDVLNDDKSTMNIEATPKYDLDEISKYVQKAADKDQLVTTPPTVDENGKIVVRNLELFSFQVNDGGKIQKEQSRFFGKKVSWRNKPVNFSFTAAGSYEAKINEMVVEIIPTVRNNMEWNKRKLQKMECRLDTRVKYRIDVTYKISGMGKMEAMIDLLPVKKIPLRVPGTPPVWLDIELAVPIGISIEGTAKGESRVIYEAEYDFYATTGYKRGEDIHTDSKQNTKVNEKAIQTQQTDFEITAELFLKPNVMIRAYRVAGPYVYLQPYVRGELEIPRRTKKDDLYVGVKGGVGVEFSEPVFTTAIMSYDSGEIFDFGTSFDLDGFEGSPRQSLEGIEKNDIHVDRIGNEGFVVINAKTLSKDSFARFELVETTKQGILIPSEDFFMSGDLHYYPLPTSTEESFVIRVTTSDGKKVDVPIKVSVSDSVQKEVAKERFGVTTNSYKVATESPELHSQNVPHYSTGNTIAVAMNADDYRYMQLRGAITETAMMVQEENYRKCRNENRMSFRSYSPTSEREDSFIRCISASSRASLQQIEQMAQYYREMAYTPINVVEGKHAVVPLASVLDNGSVSRFIDIAMNDCSRDKAEITVKGFEMSVTPSSNRCLDAFREISYPTEGDMLSSENLRIDFRYYIGSFQNGRLTFPLGHYTLNLVVVAKGKTKVTDYSRLNREYGIENLGRDFELIIESITVTSKAQKEKARYAN